MNPNFVPPSKPPTTEKKRRGKRGGRAVREREARKADALREREARQKEEKEKRNIASPPREPLKIPLTPARKKEPTRKDNHSHHLKLAHTHSEKKDQTVTFKHNDDEPCYSSGTD